MENIDILLGAKIRQIRDYKKLSQEELANRSTLHTTQVGYIERGERSCQISTLQKVANGLNVELSELFHFDSPYYEEKTDEEIAKEIVKMLLQLNKRQQLDMLNIFNSLVAWRTSADE